ncbi:phage/plasmid primase, P4 family [Sphingomonas sp. MJ1 (PH-R8)]|uniref:phage/plasmid primase, P4 family n=1 Tax=Sphingomonas sp. MJ1 (PH-R8) TaxID=3112950 RepID=UPI003A8C1A0A
MTGKRRASLIGMRIGLAKIGVPTFLVHGIDEFGDCGCGKANCTRPGKHPVAAGADRGATLDFDQIRQETNCGDWNLGLHCGLAKVVVLDVDPRNGGRETFADLQAAYGLETAVIAETGGGGEHYYYRAEPGAAYPASLGPGVDVLSGNKYPVIAPSRHASGGQYRWRKGFELIGNEFLLTHLPKPLLPSGRTAHANRPTTTEFVECDAEVARLGSALEFISADCSRNEWRDTIFAIHDTGWSCAEEFARAWSLTVPDRWSEEAFDNIWDSAKRGLAGGRTIASIYFDAKRNGWTDPASPARLETLGDIDNGRRFASRFRGELLFDRASRQWRRYDNGIWKPCDTGEHVAAGKSVVDEIVLEAGKRLAENPTDANRASHTQAVKVHRSMPRVMAMLEMAAAEPGMSVADSSAFDANPYLLGVEGGAIDLRTGKLLPPSPTNRISRCVGVRYDPTATCPRFEAFISDILADEEEVKFAQRFAGYTLTGSVAEEKLLFMQGGGANGKSVLANILSGVMGDYAVTVGFELLAVTKHEGEVSRHKVRLRGARMVLVNEVGQNDAFNDQRLKEVTSSEAIPARYLYGEAFDFDPTHKLWVRGNHRPAVLDSGDGMWRRLILLPFQRKFAPHEQVHGLDREILEEEGSGILNWCIRGCLQWQKHGLNIPKSISRETAQYRADTDVVGEWIENDCEIRPGLRGRTTPLYESYQEAMERAGMTPKSQPAFSRMMSARGFQRDSSNGKSFLHGIDLAGDI